MNKDIHGYILKGDDKTYQNIDTKVTMSEHDYNFLSTYQKSRMKVYVDKTPHIKSIDLDLNVNIL